MFRRAPARIALTAALIATACRGQTMQEERTATDSEQLSSSNLVGTSLPNKTLALTFDDGPGAHTAAMSTYLAGQGIHATFFFVGGQIAPTQLPNPNNVTVTPNVTTILARVVADGHLIGSHTTTHRDLVSEVLPTGAAKVVQELAETNTDIAPYVPSAHWLFRAPYGYYDTNVWNALKGSPMNIYVGPVRWDIGGESTNYPAQAADWACWQNALQSPGGGGTFGVSTQQCGDAYLNEIASVGRGIVLMHDSSESDNGSTLAMVQYLVPILKARGYSFARADAVPDIAALFGPPPCDPSCATCSAQGTCASCYNGTYLSNGACNACSACGSHSYVASACTTTADTTCGACDASCTTCNAAGTTHCTSCSDGSWLSAGRCRACQVCAAGSFEGDACTKTSDTVCTSCAPGTFAGASGATACTACPPGEIAPMSGATACGACGPGEFSPDPGSQSCAACPAGTFASANGATSCTSCGSCDDHDACTTDACDEVTGCVHTPIAGCVLPSDAGVPDAGGKDAGVRDSGAADAARDGATTPTEDAGAPPPATDASITEPDESESSGGGGGGGGCGVAPTRPASSGGALALGVLVAWLVRRREKKAIREPS